MFNPVYACVRSLFRFVLIKLRHCAHLALSSCLKLRAKHYMLCLVVLKACVPKLCVLLYSAVLRGSLFDMCVIVTSCEYQLDFNKGWSKFREPQHCMSQVTMIIPAASHR